MQQNINNNFCLEAENTKKCFGLENEYDYSKFASLKEFDWDDELAQKFAPIAKKLNLSQEAVDLLLELAFEMSIKQKNVYKQEVDNKILNDIQGYSELLMQDNEMPSVNSLKMKEYMRIANGAYSDFTTPKLKEILEKTGLIYHPELIKMFHKIGELMQEDNISYSNKPAIEELTPAQILYGKRD